MSLDRVCRIALGLVWGWAAALTAAPSFDAPTGLTLQAEGSGRYLMVWDPIYRDDLQGYSVWLRKPGDAEFIRLSVPVKVGKEVLKEPLTAESKVVLALGRDRNDLEMTVVAEYDQGVSPRAPSVRSALARRSDAAVAAALALSARSGEEGPAAQAVSPAALASGPGAAASEGGSAKPWEAALERAERPLIMPPGRFKTSLGLDFDYRHFSNSGFDPFGDLHLVGFPISPTTMVNWDRTDVRTIFSVPVGVRLGLLPGLEAFAEAAYHAEDYFIGDFKIDGTEYGYIRWIHVNSDGKTYTYLSNPTSTGVGDVQVGFRAQPLESRPLVLSLRAALPTGLSRFKSMLDWWAGRGSPAGTGDGALRLTFGADLGKRGLESGLSFHAAYSPGTSERYRLDDGSGGPLQDQVALHGDRVEVGGGYTFPWRLVGRTGALVVGLGGASQSPDRWTTDGVDRVALIPKPYRTVYEALSGMKFERNDQMELSLDAIQDLPRGLEVGGRLSYTMEAFGDRINVSGRFSY